MRLKSDNCTSLIIFWTTLTIFARFFALMTLIPAGETSQMQADSKTIDLYFLP